MLPQPVQQRREIALADGIEQARDLRLGGAEQLRREHRTQRVAGEIAEAAERPVDVLQAARPIVGRGHADQLAHALVPGARQIGHRQIARDQLPLQAMAQDDV